MKKTLLLILGIIFLTNTVSLTAWAKPCMMSDINIVATAEMDCHKNKQDQQHCPGICLCEHAQLNQTPILEQPIILNKTSAQFQTIFSGTKTLTSYSTPPLKRPPRT